jgi:hypothetical protein
MALKMSGEGRVREPAHITSGLMDAASVIWPVFEPAVVTGPGVRQWQ